MFLHPSVISYFILIQRLTVVTANWGLHSTRHRRRWSDSAVRARNPEAFARENPYLGSIEVDSCWGEAQCPIQFPDSLTSCRSFDPAALRSWCLTRVALDTHFFILGISWLALGEDGACAIWWIDPECWIWWQDTIRGFHQAHGGQARRCFSFLSGYSFFNRCWYIVALLLNYV